MALQRLDGGIHHYRVAAQVGDVGDRVRCELGQLLLHVATAHVGMCMRRAGCRQLARQAGDVAEARVRVGEGAELLAVQQLAGRTRAGQQHHLDPALVHLLGQYRQHCAVRRHPGAGADQQIAAVAVAGHQAEAAVGAAGLDPVADAHALEQRGCRAAGHVSDGDLHRFARTQRAVVQRGQRMAAPPRGAIGIVEVDLDELAGNEIQRLDIVTFKLVVTDRGRQYAAVNAANRKRNDGQGGRADRWGTYTSPSPQRTRPGMDAAPGISVDAGKTGDTMSTGNDASTPLFGGGAHGYRFDTYVAAMTRQMLEELLARRDGIPQPVRKLHWTGYQGYNQLTGLAINGQEWPDDFG